MSADEIIVIIIMSIVFMCFVYAFLKYDLTPIMRIAYIKCVKSIGVIIVGLIVAYLFLNLENIQPNSWVLIALYAGLVGITLVYAVGAHRQANASYEMAKEIKIQRIFTSKPIIVIKAVCEKDIWEGNVKDYFSHFEISSVGNNPAVEVEVSIMVNKTRVVPHSIRQTFLRFNNPPINFRPFNITNLDENTRYEIICDYQDIFTNYPQKSFCRTRLPFEINKASQDEKIYVVAGELEFADISVDERIDAFSRSKPQ